MFKDLRGKHNGVPSVSMAPRWRFPNIEAAIMKELPIVEEARVAGSGYGYMAGAWVGLRE